jgi:hypothetical protein
MSKKKKDSWDSIRSNPEKLKYFRREFVKNGLRRLSYRWFGRFNALKASKLERNEYFCNICGVISGKKDIQLDHKIPVVLTTGWDDFDGYVERLFCLEDGYQVLCKACHSEKSLKENSQRDRKKKKS